MWCFSLKKKLRTSFSQLIRKTISTKYRHKRIAIKTWKNKQTRCSKSTVFIYNNQSHANNTRPIPDYQIISVRLKFRALFGTYSYKGQLKQKDKIRPKSLYMFFFFLIPINSINILLGKNGFHCADRPLSRNGAFHLWVNRP